MRADDFLDEPDAPSAAGFIDGTDIEQSYHAKPSGETALPGGEFAIDRRSGTQTVYGAIAPQPHIPEPHNNYPNPFLRAGRELVGINQPAPIGALEKAGDLAGKYGLEAMFGIGAAPFGPIGVGVSVGAARALRNAAREGAVAAQYDATSRPAIQNALDPLIAGSLAAGGEMLGPVVAAARQTGVARTAADIGGKLLRGTQGVKEKVASAAILYPEKLAAAPSDEAVSSAYSAFYDKIGAKGWRDIIEASDKPIITSQKAINELESFAVKARDGRATLQDAINASQAGRLISDLKRRGNEIALEVGEKAKELKAIADETVERLAPPKLKGEWQRLREMAFWNNAYKELSSPVPLNVGGSVNQLRTYGGAAMGTLLGTTVNPLAAILPFVAQAPLTTRLALQSAAGAAKAFPYANPVMAAEGSDRLAQFYRAASAR